MKLLNRIVSTQDPLLLDIRFWPTDICNFHCAYCFPGSVTNRHRYPKNIQTVIKNFKILFDSYITHYGKEKFKINIVGGGEPTLWPHLAEFCEQVKKEHAVHIQLTSNGSRTVRWWKENTKYVDDVVLSCHPAEVDVGNFIQVADYLFERGTDVSALMLMDATVWDTCISLIARMKLSNHDWIIQAKEVVDAPGYDISSYTEDQLIYLKQPIKRAPSSDWIIENLNRFRIHESIAMYDNGSAIPVTPNYYIINKVNNFNGWNCNVAIENLVITHDGSVSGSCQEQIFSDKGINMFSEDFEEKFNKLSLQPKTFICPRRSCACQPDTHITKWIP